MALAVLTDGDGFSQNRPKCSLSESDHMPHKLQIFGQMRRGRPQSTRLPKAPKGRRKLITGLIASLRAGQVCPRGKRLWPPPLLVKA